MFSKLISHIIAPNFSKTIAVALFFAVIINGFLCYERKVLQAEAKAHRTEAALIRADNQNLANQLENANLAIAQYRQQVKALHDNVLNRLQQAENRSNELIKELDKHQTWRTQPLPAGVGKLLNQRSGQISASQTQPTTLPPNKPMPNAPVQPKK